MDASIAAADAAAGVDSSPAGDSSDGSSAPDSDGSPTANDTGPVVGTCSGLCVGPAPQGWVGPFAHSVTQGGLPQPTPPDCAAPYATKLTDYTRDLNGPPATCTCACGAPTGITCTKPQLTLYADGTCNATCATQEINDTCTPLALGGCPNKPRGNVALSTAVGGACTPTATTSVPDKSWSTAVRLCSLTDPTTTGTCSNNRVCKPTPALPHVTGSLCVAATGTLDCPADYPERQIVYDNASDDRNCSACTCAVPAGATCSVASVTGYDNAGCSGATHALTSGSCVVAGAHAQVLTPPVASGGTCAAVGGQPVGSAAPLNPTTICCSK